MNSTYIVIYINRCGYKNKSIMKLVGLNIPAWPYLREYSSVSVLM